MESLWGHFLSLRGHFRTCWGHFLSLWDHFRSVWQASQPSRIQTSYPTFGARIPHSTLNISNSTFWCLLDKSFILWGKRCLFVCITQNPMEIHPEIQLKIIFFNFGLSLQTKTYPLGGWLCSKPCFAPLFISLYDVKIRLASLAL